MHLEIPEGANVQIIVGSPTPQALADESRQARPAQTGGGPILKGLAVAIGLVGTFVVGQHFGGRAANTQTAAAFSTPPPAPTREQHAFPGRATPLFAAATGFRRSAARVPGPTAPAADRDASSWDDIRQDPVWLGAVKLAIPRQIVGPQEQFERTGAQSLRDIRPFTTRLSEGLRSSASGIVLAIAAGATFFEPAVVNVTVPLSALYALWVLTRRPKPCPPATLRGDPRSQQSDTWQPQTEAGERDGIHRMEHFGSRTLGDGRGRPAAHDDSGTTGAGKTTAP